MRKLLASVAVAIGIMTAPAFAQLPPTGPIFPPIPPFDPAAGNAPIELIIPSALPSLFVDISQNAGDATLVLRLTTMLTNSWFDAIAPYDDTAVGVYSRPPRQQVADTLENKNISIIYASYRVFNSLLPHRKARWDEMMAAAGLDPDDTSTDPATAIGLGNLTGNAVVAGRENDGMNQLGNEGRDYNFTPYADYTGYVPRNTAYRLKKPLLWQPDVQRQGIGLYKVQQFVTPQYALVEPYSYDDPADFGVPAPIKNFTKANGPYKDQADEVLLLSAMLDDQMKLKAEFFDNKIVSLGLSALTASLTRGHSLEEFVHLDFLTNMAAFDAGIATWRSKYEHDAVRPFSAIQAVYGDDEVYAWGGPYMGPTMLPASQWKSYLEEADHPEYPSASTCFCNAHAQSARLLLGTDLIAGGGAPGFITPYPAGSSRIEPGLVPATDTQVVYTTWTEFAEDCGESRIWAGVHFRAAVDASAELCPIFGDMAYDYLQSLLDGSAPMRLPSDGRPVDTLPD